MVNCMIFCFRYLQRLESTTLFATTSYVSWWIEKISRKIVSERISFGDDSSMMSTFIEKIFLVNLLFLAQCNFSWLKSFLEKFTIYSRDITFYSAFVSCFNLKKKTVIFFRSIFFLKEIFRMKAFYCPLWTAKHRTYNFERC